MSNADTFGDPVRDARDQFIAWFEEVRVILAADFDMPVSPPWDYLANYVAGVSPGVAAELAAATTRTDDDAFDW
jgi:hypothetical protein